MSAGERGPIRCGPRLCSARLALALLVASLLPPSAAANPLELVPKPSVTIVEYHSRSGLPEATDWARTLVGRIPGSVTAVMKNGLLDLRDESQAEDGLTYRKTIDPKWAGRMASDGWILEVQLTLHGSTVFIVSGDASKCTTQGRVKVYHPWAG